VSQVPSQTVSLLLLKWRSGDEEALQALIPLVYKDLRALAHRYLRNERSGHSMQTTDLVHETYLRIAGQNPFDAQSRTHFIAIAARLMRQILVDYARTHHAAKRGAHLRVTLNTAIAPPIARTTDLVALDDALLELARIDEQQSRIVELRFFGGLTNEEAAEVLGISRSTVKRDWNVAKAWLTRQMKKGSHAEPATVAED
jgi:RNA polymerase sigma factor (TIGR02999 family)